MRWHAFLIALLLGAPPAAALEPERREVVVTHNRVWDGYRYEENFVPSDRGEMFLMSGAASAVTFVRTQEYYWPLARRTYVAFETQRDELDGVLVVRDRSGIVAEIAADDFAMVYPEGAARGRGHLVWGEAAHAAHAEFRREERAFIAAVAAFQGAQRAHERALREAGAARMRGESPPEVGPAPEPPAAFLKLVTEPRRAFRVDLPPGSYRAELVADGASVPGTATRLRVIDVGDSAVLTADIVPSERWTRPLGADSPRARIYVRPGATIYMTLHHGSRFPEADYLRIVRPQATAPEGREIVVRRAPARVAAVALDWQDGAGPASVARGALKVEQTQGANFGYVVRAAREGETPDLDAFAIAIPADPALRRGRIEAPGGLRREIVVVQPRIVAAIWSLALFPAAIGGLFLLVRAYRDRQASV